MRGSIPDRISGTVEIVVALADEAGVEPQVLADLVSTWVRAEEIGFFGPGRIRVQGAVETHGQQVSARVECDQVSPTAFRVLARMIRYFSRMKGTVKTFDVFHESRLAVTPRGAVVPTLPSSIPFAVEYPEDLKRYVRVEIEFHRAVTERERDAIFNALSIWDVLIEALAGKEWWGQQKDPESQSEYQSRLLAPAIIEHEVDGYFASIACLHFIVWLGLRLHQRLMIERITME